MAEVPRGARDFGARLGRRVNASSLNPAVLTNDDEVRQSQGVARCIGPVPFHP